LATVVERQARDEATSVEATSALLKVALNQYLDVLYDAEPPLFWRRYAGFEAARLAETMADWLAARNVYRQMRDLFPVLRPRLEEKILAAQKHLPPPETD
jgi:hypothetical protein